MKSYSEELADSAAIDNLRAEIDFKYLKRIKALEETSFEHAMKISSLRIYAGFLTIFLALSFLH